MLLSGCELCIDQCNDSHTLPETVNKFLCVISTFFIQLGGEIWYKKSAHNAVKHL